MEECDYNSTVGSRCYGFPISYHHHHHLHHYRKSTTDASSGWIGTES